jgi:hypothetical protein
MLFLKTGPFNKKTRSVYAFFENKLFHHTNHNNFLSGHNDLKHFIVLQRFRLSEKSS